MRDLLADLLQQATRRGATAADAFVVEDQSFSAQVRLGQVDTVKHAREQHMALRVFVGQSVAAASTSDLSPESVARLVDEAVSLARITSPDEMGGLPEVTELARQVPDLDLRDARGHDLTPEEKIELARRTLDENKRMEIWHECHKIMHDDQPYTFLYTDKQTAFHDARLKNIEFYKIRPGYDVREWFSSKPRELDN